MLEDVYLAQLLESSPVVGGVLLLLLFFSMVSWAIVFYKYRVFRRAAREGRAFSRIFREGTNLDQIYRRSLNLNHSPMAETFKAGYNELMKVMKSRDNPVEASFIGMELTGLDAISRTVRGAGAAQLSRLEKYLSFLATTGSTCPFIGLFGTVWGIMSTFRGIGLKGQATLAVVAPGIAEALIATAAGLAAAIPAVVAYNHYVNKVNRVSVDLDNFTAEFLNIVERRFFRTVKG